jgi:DNA-binding transcriptional ArsR family regulator
MLDALMDGIALPAGDLARRAGVSPSTASGHLARLRDGGLVCCDPQGRERRYRLASAQVAAALEGLALIAPTTPISSLRSFNRTEALRSARTCYDHLAGLVGVSITEALVRRGALIAHDSSYTLAPGGEELLSQLGVDVEAASVQRRSFARACLDWSERRPHLAGALGAGLAQAFVANRWLQRRPADRALTVTPGGAATLREVLGIDLDRMTA